MNIKRKCFISYNRKDNDLKTILALISYLREISQDTIEFLLDENFSAGEDLNEYMSSIHEVDSIIMLLTPGYKTKVEDRTSSGVFTEARLILDRIEKLEEQKKESGINELMVKNFAVFPIIFTRTFDQSCPKIFSHLKCLDFTDFQVKTNGKLPSSLLIKYDEKLHAIVSEIYTVESLNSESVQEKYKQTLKTLFLETKHNSIENSTYARMRDFYVKTSSYHNLKEQKTHFFLGRKGSGKSTLGPQFYFLEEKKFKPKIDINVDLINLDYLYDITLSGSDLGVVLPYTTFFKYAWEMLIYVNCFQIVINEQNNEKANASHFNTLKKFLQTFRGNTKIKGTFDFAQKRDKNEDLNAIFQWCLAGLLEHIKKSLLSTRNDESSFHYDLNKAMTKNDVLFATFSEKVLQSFYSIIKSDTKKFLITFDGFDTMFEKFRYQTSLYKDDDEIRINRVKLETGLLEGFLDLINEIKSNEMSNYFYESICVCATVPKDRFFEIKATQRDSYRYINKFHEIKWTGIELAILLRKRLELLKSFKTTKSLSAKDRLMEVIDRKLPALPKETVIKIGDRHFAKEVFLDVIRHSFWRPREILIYFSRLITIVDDLEKRNYQPDDITVSKIISETTFDIINEEFISEFKNYCTNLDVILNAFVYSKQILNIKSLNEQIGKVHFNFIDQVEAVKSLDDKIDFLFEIGFLGLEVSDKIIERYKILFKDVFSFNVTNKTYEKLKFNKFEGCNFVVHPVFCEYLSLNTVGQERLTLDINWSYLKSQDLHNKI